MAKHELIIKHLVAEVNGKRVVENVTLSLASNHVIAVMGPNAAGKSSLCNVIAGHPGYKVISGSASLDGKDLLAMTPDERARHGVFLAFQHPIEIEGVNFGAFLLQAFKARFPGASPSEFYKALDAALQTLELDRSFSERELNVGFSGGEKKRAEMLQLLMLKPVFALLDETDSGLDIDSLKIVARAIDALAKEGAGVLVVTHYKRILEHVKADAVHVMLKGAIVQSGDMALVHELEKKGYAWLKPGALKVV
jgi:Fe-S cluster assembly ATP-binding protein